MDEIAPEYDVIVLGTGEYSNPASDPAGQATAKGNPANDDHVFCNRLDRVHPVRVWASMHTLRGSWSIPLTDVWLPIDSVLSVKGKKVLHIDRNDHYGG